MRQRAPYKSQLFIHLSPKPGLAWPSSNLSPGGVPILCCLTSMGLTIPSISFLRRLCFFCARLHRFCSSSKLPPFLQPHTSMSHTEGKSSWDAGQPGRFASSPKQAYKSESLSNLRYTRYTNWAALKASVTEADSPLPKPSSNVSDSFVETLYLDGKSLSTNLQGTIR